ncbi:MAG: hypothetical protein AAGJ28_11330 [Pseudomonadota bacterium]
MSEIYSAQVRLVKRIKARGHSYSEIAEAAGVKDSSLRAYVSRQSERQISDRSATKAPRRTNIVAVALHSLLLGNGKNRDGSILKREDRIDYRSTCGDTDAQNSVVYKMSKLHSFNSEQILAVSRISAHFFGRDPGNIDQNIPSEYFGRFHMYYLSYGEPIVVKSVFTIDIDYHGEKKYQYFKHFHKSKTGRMTKITTGSVIFERGMLICFGKISNGMGNSIYMFRAPILDEVDKIYGFCLATASSGEIVCSKVCMMPAPWANEDKDLARISADEFDARQFDLKSADLRLYSDFNIAASL